MATKKPKQLTPAQKAAETRKNNRLMKDMLEDPSAETFAAAGLGFQKIKHDDQLEAVDPRYNQVKSWSEHNIPVPAAMVDPTDSREYTGGSVGYYKIHVENPTTLSAPYDVECNDIIEALQMDYAEGNAFKAIWRIAAARLGKSKRGYVDPVYDAEKTEFFGGRMVSQAKHKRMKALRNS